MPQRLASIQPNTWTLLTTNDVTSGVTFQCPHGNQANVLLCGTAGATPPTSTDNTLRYAPGQGEINVLLSEMFPGVPGVNRLYAFSTFSQAAVFISHA